RPGSHPFVALNTALFQDGGYVLVEKGVEVDRPLHVVCLATGGGAPIACHPRTVLIAEAGAKATFIETFAGVGEGGSFTNAVTETWVGAEAKVHHAMLELATLEAFHMATHQIRLDRGSHLTTHSVSLGGALVRNELNTVLDGEGVWLQMYGLFRVAGTQHIDNHTSIDHPQPHSDSREMYKGLLDGKGKAIFHGKIIVRKDAQLTNAYQENRNLLLSDEAIVDTKPQLEIHANDVKCKHGANIGHVSEDHIHYLRTRGVGKEEARRILVHAFGAEMIQELPVEAVRTRLAGMVYELLGGDPRDAVLWGA
ncbi:MAG: Fe-S cluster assembly protein SufD, partial [Planctomycetota bacterium]